tara:strand:+ start:248 stop:430 length:183 start_codon:yes stop_codon:yes gene_type:complete
MLKKLFNKIIKARTESAKRRIAMMQLYTLNDRELKDIGIARGDIERAVKYGCKEANHYYT